MDENIKYNSITITTLGEQNQVEFAVQRTAGDQREHVALAVLIPLQGQLSIRDAQVQAIHRAIELLKMTLPEQQPPGG